MGKDGWLPGAPRISWLFVKMVKEFAEERGLSLGTGNWAPGTHVPSGDFNTLFASVAHQSGDPNFGLHLAERFHAAMSGGILAALQANSPDIGHAIDSLCRYHGLMGDYIRPVFERGPSRGVLYCRWQEEGPHPERHAMEGILCTVALNLRRLTNGRLSFAEVRFSHSRPSDVREHERLFECPVSFGRSVNAIVLEAEELEQPVLLADLTLLHKLERIAQEELKELPRSEWSSRATEAIHRRLLSGETCTLGAIAAELAIGARTLQNRLKEENVSFRQLLEQVRRKMALAYLGKTDMSLFDIAYVLGFSDQSAFNHAFRRWTGTHPKKYKR